MYIIIYIVILPNKMMVAIIKSQDHMLKMTPCLVLGKPSFADKVFKKLSTFHIFENDVPEDQSCVNVYVCDSGKKTNIQIGWCFIINNIQEPHNVWMAYKLHDGDLPPYSLFYRRIRRQKRLADNLNGDMFSSVSMNSKFDTTYKMDPWLI